MKKLVLAVGAVLSVGAAFTASYVRGATGDYNDVVGAAVYDCKGLLLMVK